MKEGPCAIRAEASTRREEKRRRGESSGASPCTQELWNQERGRGERRGWLRMSFFEAVGMKEEGAACFTSV